MTIIHLGDLYQIKPLEACRKALAMTRSVRWQDRLERINEILGLYGTEAIRGEWQSGYWGNTVASYCNAGDTYNVTVIHVRGDDRNPAGRFIVNSWGDWVEKNQHKYSIQLFFNLIALTTRTNKP